MFSAVALNSYFSIRQGNRSVRLMLDDDNFTIASSRTNSYHAALQ